MMLRLIGYMLFAIVLITILRNVIGMLTRVFFTLARASVKPPEAQAGMPLTGELKKDPVCGTYIAAATSLHKTIGEQTFYFCSPQCRDNFRISA